MSRIISVGTDKKILEGGRVFERVKEYASLVDGEYYTFVFGGEKVGASPSPEGGGLGWGPALGNFHAIALAKSNKLLQILNLFSELRKLKLSKDDILYPQDPFEIGLISYLLAKFYGSKLYVQCHTDTSSENFRNESKRNYLQYLISKFVFKRADKIRVVSKRMKDYLINEFKIDKDKILELPIYFDGVGTGSLSLGEGRGEGYNFLILSRLEKVKNIQVAIQAVQNIREKTGQNLTIKIVGSGALSPLSFGERSGERVMDWLISAPWTDNPNQEYQNAKYFLLPSLYEGWGMTAVESVANGTPVIMTDVGCAHEFIKNEVNGFISTGFDTSSFEEAIYKAMNFNFDKDIMQNSLKNLMTREVYLENLKKFLNE